MCTYGATGTCAGPGRGGANCVSAPAQCCRQSPNNVISLVQTAHKFAFCSLHNLQGPKCKAEHRRRAAGDGSLCCWCPQSPPVPNHPNPTFTHTLEPGAQHKASGSQQTPARMESGTAVDFIIVPKLNLVTPQSATAGVWPCPTLWGEVRAPYIFHAAQRPECHIMGYEPVLCLVSFRCWQVQAQVRLPRGATWKQKRTRAGATCMCLSGPARR